MVGVLYSIYVKREVPLDRATAFILVSGWRGGIELWVEVVERKCSSFYCIARFCWLVGFLELCYWEDTMENPNMDLEDAYHWSFVVAYVASMKIILQQYGSSYIGQLDTAEVVNILKTDKL